MNKGFIKNKLLNTKNNYRKINQGLKRYFWHWLLINNELKVFKNISTLCEHFQLSNKINTREILNVLNNKLGNVRSLF